MPDRDALLRPTVAVGAVVLLAQAWRTAAGPAHLAVGWDVVLPTLGFVLGAVLAVVSAVRSRRPDDAVLAIGLTVYAMSWAHRLVVIRDGTAYPTVGDALWLALPLSVAIALLLHGGRLRGVRRATWMDLAIGAGGGGAAASAFLVARAAQTGASPASMLMDAAYVVGDTAMVVAVVTALAGRRRTPGERPPVHLVLRAVGALVLVGADLAYSWANVTLGGMAPGSPIGLLWVLGFWLLVLSVGLRRGGDRPSPGQPRDVLVVPLLGTVVSVLVLVGDEPGRVVRAIAAGAILLATARMGLAFREAAALAGSRELARTDELTGLANRRAFYQDAERILSDGPASVLLVDLDGFKAVNDALGHAAGDELLRLAGARLVAAARTEGRRSGQARRADVVARLGGDEFAVVLPDVDEATGADVGRRLVEVLGAPYELAGTSVRVTAATGVVHRPRHGVGVDELLVRADIAMYASKAEGLGVVVYDPALPARRGRTPEPS